MKRALLLLLAAALVFPLLGIAAFYGYENWAGAIAWREVESRLQAAGEPLSVEALRPGAIPDSENMAAAPVFQKLFAFTNPRRSELYALRLPPAPRAAAAPETSLTALAGLARRFDAGFTGDSQSAARIVLAGLAPMEPILDSIRLAAERPDAVWPVQYEKGFAASIPFLKPLRQVAEILAARAVVAVAENRPADALSDLELITRLARDVNQPAVLAGSMAQQTMLNHAVDIVRDGLVQGIWSEADLTRIQDELADFRLLDSFRQSVRGERVLFLAAPEVVSARVQPLFMLVDFRTPASEWVTSSLCHLAWNLRPSGWMNRDRASYAALAQDWLSVVIHKNCIRPWALTEWNLRIASLRRDPVQFFRTPVTAMALAGFMPVARSAAYTQSRVDFARIACAIERCRRETGAVPSSLADLAPGWIDAVPRDSVGGSPYFFRSGGQDSYSLHGKGWNARDDGGSSANANALLGPSTADDWVWEPNPRWQAAAAR